jgi:predicted transcriptional regulator
VGVKRTIVLAEDIDKLLNLAMRGLRKQRSEYIEEALRDRIAKDWPRIQEAVKEGLEEDMSMIKSLNPKKKKGDNV